MTTLTLFILSITCLLLGHFFKTVRWSIMLRPLVKARKSTYYLSLSLGYFINFLFPFKLGEILRAFVFSRLTKLQFSYVFASVIIDRILDFFCVTAAMIGYAAYILYVAHRPMDYSVILTHIGIIAAFFMLLRLVTKRQLLWASSIFNNTLKRQILTFFWCFQILVKLLKKEEAIRQMIFFTICMWASYIAAVFMFSSYLKSIDVGASFHDIFSQQYYSSNLLKSDFLKILGTHSDYKAALLFQYFLYAVFPLLCLALYQWIGNRYQDSQVVRFVNKSNRFFHVLEAEQKVLLFKSDDDTLHFLESVFCEKSIEGQIVMYENNQDITILKDLSGSSSATTCLVQKDDTLLIRKYTLKSDAEKLKVQYDWLMTYRNTLPVAEILGCTQKTDYFSYDMRYFPNSFPFFEYIHAYDVQKSWNSLRSLFDQLEEKLYLPTKKEASASAITHYVEAKLFSNLRLIKEVFQKQHGLWDHATLKINDIEVPNIQTTLPFFLKGIDYHRVFTAETTVVHGDFTVENIVALSETEWFMIDPYPENIFNSKFLDYSKMAQSLNMGYEFLRKVEAVVGDDNTIRYPQTRSSQYKELNQHFEAYILNKYSKKGLQEVRLHEIIHYARLLPYQIQRGRKQAPIFYCTLAILMARYKEDYFSL